MQLVSWLNSDNALIQNLSENEVFSCFGFLPAVQKHKLFEVA